MSNEIEKTNILKELEILRTRKNNKLKPSKIQTGLVLALFNHRTTKYLEIIENGGNRSSEEDKLKRTHKFINVPLKWKTKSDILKTQEGWENQHETNYFQQYKLKDERWFSKEIKKLVKQKIVLEKYKTYEMISGKQTKKPVYCLSKSENVIGIILSTILQLDYFNKTHYHRDYLNNSDYGRIESPAVAKVFKTFELIVKVFAENRAHDDLTIYLDLVKRYDFSKINKEKSFEDNWKVFQKTLYKKTTKRRKKTNKK